jgi:hypothetical protein
MIRVVTIYSFYMSPVPYCTEYFFYDIQVYFAICSNTIRINVLLDCVHRPRFQKILNLFKLSAKLGTHTTIRLGQINTRAMLGK